MVLAVLVVEHLHVVVGGVGLAAVLVHVGVIDGRMTPGTRLSHTRKMQNAAENRAERRRCCRAGARRPCASSTTCRKHQIAKNRPLQTIAVIAQW